MSTATLDSLAHPWDVLRAALDMEKLRAANKRHCSDTAFLPAALEVMETPPSPAARGLLWSMMVLVGVAAGWSVIGRVDVVAVAPGKLIPEERVKIIQWGGAGGGSDGGQTGVIRAIHVSDGMMVKAGQVLLELDTTLTGADSAQAQRGLLSAELEQARAQAIARHLRGLPMRYQPPATAPADLISTQKSLIDSTIAQYEARRAGLLQQRASAAADVQAAQAEQAKLAETLPLLAQQVAARQELADKGYGSKLTLWQIQEQLIERKKNIAIQSSTIAKTRAAIANIDTQLAGLRQDLATQSYTGLAKAEDDAALRNQEITKATQRARLTKITAPVDGTVSQLGIHTIGGVIQAAQPLMTIVPKDSTLVIEAQVENRDIGFLKKGQPVKVKLDAFPFTDYGMIDATLDDISADAIATDDNGTRSGENAKSKPTGGLVYSARVRLDPASVARFTSMICRARGTRLVPLDAANPKSTEALMCARTVITPGMAAQAEIKTGNRRIISYLLSPLRQTTQEAGRER